MSEQYYGFWIAGSFSEPDPEKHHWYPKKGEVVLSGSFGEDLVMQHVRGTGRVSPHYYKKIEIDGKYYVYTIEENISNHNLLDVCSISSDNDGVLMLHEIFWSKHHSKIGLGMTEADIIDVYMTPRTENSANWQCRKPD